MSRRFLAVVLAAAALMVMPLMVTPAEAAVPSKSQWLKDTRSAMFGSRAWINAAVERGGTRLAVNLDIDNTSLATYYARRRPVPVVLRFAKYARSKGVAVFFNTGRLDGRLRSITKALRAAGYPVNGVCGRRSNERLRVSKQRCRREYTARGFTIVANVGNRSTDFDGGDYERAFKLPDYGNQLG